jgi:hypothetical protein
MNKKPNKGEIWISNNSKLIIIVISEEMRSRSFTNYMQFSSVPWSNGYMNSNPTDYITTKFTKLEKQ